MAKFKGLTLQDTIVLGFKQGDVFKNISTLPVFLFKNPRSGNSVDTIQPSEHVMFLKAVTCFAILDWKRLYIKGLSPRGVGWFWGGIFDRLKMVYQPL